MLLPSLNMLLKWHPHGLLHYTVCTNTVVSPQVMIIIICCAMHKIKCVTDKQLFPVFSCLHATVGFHITSSNAKTAKNSIILVEFTQHLLWYTVPPQ